ARLCGVKVIFMSVGVSQISSPLSKLMFKWSLALASYRSFRDERSRQTMESIGIRGDNRVRPDLVFSLALANAAKPKPIRRRRTVGINAIPYCDGTYWPEEDKAAYGHYVANLAAFGLWLLQKG